MLSTTRRFEMSLWYCVASALIPAVATHAEPVAVDAPDFTEAVRAQAYPATATYERTTPGEATAAAAQGGELLVYSNTGSDLFFPPGANRQIGDDLRTLSSCGCTLENYRVLVSGGGDGTGEGFTVTYGLYSACPDDGGILVPGTGGSQVFPDDGDYLMTVLPTAPVAIPRRLWIILEFDRNNAGWFSGAPADSNSGVTADIYYLQNFACDSQIAGGQVYAGFYVQLFCDPNGGPGPASVNDPADGATNMNPASTVLEWNSPGSFLIGGDGSGPISDSVDPSAGRDPEAYENWIDPNWLDNVHHEGCGTQEHYEAKLAARGEGGGGEGGISAGACDLGICDNPSTRDQFIPDATTPQKVYQIHFHIFCNDGGGGCTSSVPEVNAQLNTINNNFAPYRITFEADISVHNDSTYVNLDGGEEVSMKSQYAVDPETTLNFFISEPGCVSWGTFPWDPDATTFMGGVVNSDCQFSANSATPTHEIGHCIGLWHTHHGVSEVGQCGACYESPNDNSSTVGDFCADTAPTPTNFGCGNPGGTDACTGDAWGSTDFTNYMSYSSCRNEFSPQQAGRMHCWTEDRLPNWVLASCGATYDVLFGTTNPPDSILCSGVTDLSCDPGPLSCGETYYWQVTTTSTESGESTTSPVWSFSTPTGPDCNNNGTADFCDVAFGGSADCNNNNQPDECEADCNNNQIADTCELAGNDCNFNSVPDECDPDADGDQVPDLCDICAGGNDAFDADFDGVPDFCDICAGGDDNLDNDGDTVPDFCDICPLDNPDDPDGDSVCTSDDNCDEFNPDQLDCQPNGVGDVCDISGGGSSDNNGNDLPDECEISPPLAEDSMQLGCGTDTDCTNEAVCRGGLCYAPKNRYISVAPNPVNGTTQVAIRISMDGTVLGWVGTPNGNNISGVSDTPVYLNWNVPGTVHVGDCHISPGRAYDLQAIVNGLDIGDEANFSAGLNLPTVSTLGDVGGDVIDGTMLPANTTANFADILAVIQGFQGEATAPDTWLDLEGEQPNLNVGLADAQIAVIGFQNGAYPFADPCTCAGLAPCP